MSDDIKLPELLCCPFCGGTDLDVMNPVSCNTCLSSGPMIIAPSREEVIAIWNKRAAVELNRAWLPIESAPKDGTVILLYCPHGDGNPGSTFRVTCGNWCEDHGGIIEHRDLEGRWAGQDESDGFIGWLSWDGGFSEDTMMPTHWMPLPPPPEHREDK